MAIEDDFYTNRFGSATGRANEREMLGHVTVDSPRTRQRLHPDGSETLLKTGAGIAKFLTTKPEEEPDRKEYELVGEPMYRGLDGITVLGAFLIKIVFGTNFFGKTLIPMDEYTGLDVTDEWLRYRRNNHWSELTPAGDYIRSQAGHRHVMHADRITSGYVAPFSLNGTFEAFEPENAWAYALRNMLYDGVTTDWLLCNHGVSYWPASTTVDPFPIPDWVGYGPTTYWDDWYNIHRAHVFFTPNADLLVFCCYMPHLDTGSPPLRKLSSITTYDIDAETLTTTAQESWHDVVSGTHTVTIVPSGGILTENTYTTTAIDRVYPLSAVATKGTPDTIEAMTLTAIGSGTVSTSADNTVPSGSSIWTSSLNVKWKLGTRVLHDRTVNWRLDSANGAGGYFWGTTGFACYEYGLLACPEQQAYVLVEVETTLPDFSHSAGNTPVPTSRIRAHVFDARTDKLYHVVGIPVVGDHKLGSIAAMLPATSISVPSLLIPPAYRDKPFVYSATIEANSPVSGNSTDTNAYNTYAMASEFVSGSMSYYNNDTETWVDCTPPAGYTMQPTVYCPFSFSKTDLNANVGCVGSVVGTDDMIVASIRHPDRSTNPAALVAAFPAPQVVYHDYYLTFAINRKTGAIVIRPSEDHGFANLYERMKTLP